MAINRDKIYEGAMKLLTSGKPEKAIVEFQKLLVDDPKDVRTLLKIAETFSVKMGNRKEALTHYDKAATIYTEQGFFLKAVAVFKQMLTVDGTDPNLHLRMAELYQQLGYGSQCLVHYQQVVLLYEQQEVPKDKVLDILKRMVDLDPENLASRTRVAELFAQAGKLPEAVAELRSAFDYLKAQQRYDDGLRVGERLLQLDPNAVDVARELATIYMSRQDAKQALAKLQLCFKVDPRNLEVLTAIAEAFRALDQVPKTISVYKEIARIHEANSEADKAREAWERVLDLQPGDDDAEIALGRRAATVLATAAAPAPAAAPAAPAAPRVNPEDEQLQRLLTETDVYVKYGLRDKAIEHLEKIFAIRPDHLPGLEKLKQLQTQTKQPTADTLRRLIAKGEEVNHPKVAEWKAELSRAGAAKPAPKPAPAPQPAPKKPAAPLSTEGEVILVEEDAPVAPPAPRPAPPAPAKKPPPPVIRGGSPRQIEDLDAPTMQMGRPPPQPNMLASLPSQAAPYDDEPLEPVRTRQSAPAPMAMASPLGSDEPLGGDYGDEPLAPPAQQARVNGGQNGRALPPDEALQDDFLPPQLQKPAAKAPPRDVPRPATIGLSPPVAAAPEMVLDEVEADADALVREALGMQGGMQGGELSAEGMPADELVLEQEDATEPPLPTLTASRPTGPAPVDEFADFNDATAALPPRVPNTASSFDDGELDALAAAAVQEALPARPAAPADDMMSLSDAEMGELQKFVEQASAEGAPVGDAPPGLPPEFGGGDDDDFTGERTVAYGTEAFTAPAPVTNGDDEDNVETGERKQVQRPPAPNPASEAFDAVADAIPEQAFASPPKSASTFNPSSTSEFNPDEFDLPEDVKAMLAAKPGEAPPPSFALNDDLGDTGALSSQSTGQFDAPPSKSSIASIPSLASMDADAVVEMPPPMSSQPPFSAGAPVADVDDAGLDLPSQSRNLFAVARGFEDDPANTFFPDELAEAEFFIQQELLDEAREILEPILEEVEDSLRVQHMLARVTAKENGEPEPPAPWEQKLIDDVGKELDDLAALAPAPAQAAPDQVSVEEVLSQFKKGIAETVPEDDAATHYDLGIAYREMGLLDDAVAEFEISSRAPSKSADSWFLVGLVRLDQGRADDALGALEKAYFSATASKDQRAAAEYQRGVIYEDHKKSGKEALVCLKRSQQLGGTAPDLARRIAALTKAHGDVDVPEKKSSNGNGSANGNGVHKPAAAAGPGRPKNIDYV